ncbi:hypothetical protein ES707_05859 [subsurface metagenome]
MKSTDIARRDRELRREQKRQQILDRRADKKGRTVGDYINDLCSLFFHDDNKIYNTTDNNDQIIDLLETMKIELADKQWENVLHKAIKKTQVKQRESAYKELKEILDAV